ARGAAAARRTPDGQAERQEGQREDAQHPVARHRDAGHRQARGDETRHGQAQHDRTIGVRADRKSTRLNSSHVKIPYAVLCLKKKKHREPPRWGIRHLARDLATCPDGQHPAAGSTFYLGTEIEPILLMMLTRTSHATLAMLPI